MSSGASLATERSRGNLSVRSGRTASRKNSSRAATSDDGSTGGGVAGGATSARRKSGKNKDTPELDAQVLSSLTEGDEAEDGGAEEAKGEGEVWSTNLHHDRDSNGEVSDNAAVGDEAEGAEGNEESIVSIAEDEPSLPLLLDQTFEESLYEDMLFPIREREFVELMVRVIAEASSRKQGGVSGSGLFDNIYRIFAETVGYILDRLAQYLICTLY